MNYYYFAATLPAVSLTAEPQWTLDQFVAAASEQLTAGDRRELAAILAGGGTSSFAKEWREYRHQIAVAAARLRAERRGLDLAAIGTDEESPLDVRAAVGEAFLAADPMERQRRLDGLLWRRLESLRQWAPFSPAAVFAFGCQIQLAWQWQPRTQEEGQRALDEQRQRLLAAFKDLEFTMAAEGTA